MPQNGVFKNVSFAGCFVSVIIVLFDLSYKLLVVLALALDRQDTLAVAGLCSCHDSFFSCKVFVLGTWGFRVFESDANSSSTALAVVTTATQAVAATAAVATAVAVVTAAVVTAAVDTVVAAADTVVVVATAVVLAVVTV